MLASAEEGTGERFHREPKDEARRWRRLFSAPVAALLIKDSKYLWRDSVLLSQVTMPLILFLVPFLLALQDSAKELRQELHGATLVMIGVILFMQTSILALSSIGLESRSFWIVRNAPNSGRLLLRAKFILSTLGKSRGYSTGVHVEGSMQQTGRVVVILPDNGRDRKPRHCPEPLR